jgi:hypothetical protein
MVKYGSSVPFFIGFYNRDPQLNFKVDLKEMSLALLKMIKAIWHHGVFC